MEGHIDQSETELIGKQNLTYPDRWSSLVPKLKHILHCAVMLWIIGLCIGQSVKVGYGVLTKAGNFNDDLDPFEAYGTYFTIILYTPRFLAASVMPFIIFSFCGLFFFNCFNEKVSLRCCPSQAPSLCFRIVTRGYYPDLVSRNVLRNLEMCLQEKLGDFAIEVITDNPIDGLLEHSKVKEFVVPSEYQTCKGSLFKSRALQYALEKDTRLLKDYDYIVHLDEETLLTRNSIHGILNFTTDGKHPIGQGVITYASGSVINWISTLQDSIRVADDIGRLKFQFRVFHKPLYGLKGSFLVINSKVEHDVSFDHGPDGSVAEDTFFAMIAFKKGYSFDFIEGEMHEKSPFTLTDLLKQRKRWIQGSILVAHSSEIPLKNKFLFVLLLYSILLSPITILGNIVSLFYPLLNNRLIGLNIMTAFITAMTVYTSIFGIVKSYSLKEISIWHFLLGIFGILCLLPFNLILTAICVLQSLIGDKYTYQIVQK
ncbi:beta-1,4-mannosyltransferase egh-like [Brevipalpus obovatus]|uniref:beta-1,4-mannosyltransferase egh-like n=1 Tax=Brevipalpus obovatus TaxID=246614 RepID=UPI003D9EBDBF